MVAKKPTRSILIAVLTSMTGLAACSSSSGETTGGTSSGATGPSTNATHCPSWTGELDAYGGPDVTHEGVSNAFKFDLMSVSPAPPSLGTTVWKLKIADANGQPVKDATFTQIKTWMPQHQHSSTALAVPSNNGDGSYTIDNLYLYMPGVWEVTFFAKSGNTTDSALFRFCLGT